MALQPARPAVMGELHSMPGRNWRSFENTLSSPMTMVPEVQP